MKFVIEVGPSVLVHDGEVNDQFISKMCRQIAGMINDGHGVALVSGGAASVGRANLKNAQKPDLAANHGICAALGRPLLMEQYRKALNFFSVASGQVSFNTAADLQDKNAISTLRQSIDGEILQIIDSNTGIENPQGLPNLSASIAKIVNADKSILISDEERKLSALRSQQLFLRSAEIDELGKRALGQEFQKQRLTTTPPPNTNARAIRPQIGE
jgi:glutamate 5-kinase